MHRNKSETVSILLRDVDPSIPVKGVNCLAQLDSQWLFTGGRDGIVRQYHLPTLAYQKHYEHHIHWVNDLAIDPERQIMFSASSDTSVNIWKIDEGLVHSLTSHIDYLQALCYRGTQLISGG
jgi:WD40 repeat protein